MVVGTADRVDIPPHAKIIDAKNMAILPEFINAYVHNAYRDFNLRTWAQDGVTRYGIWKRSLESKPFQYVTSYSRAQGMPAERQLSWPMPQEEERE